MEKNVYSQLQYAKKKNDLDIIEKLYRENKRDLIIEFEYAKMLIKNGILDEAREILEKQINTTNYIYAKFELGKISALEGKTEEARKHYQDLAELDDRYAMTELGMLEANYERFNEARIWFQKLINKYDDSLAKYELGMVEYRCKNYDLARTLFNKLKKTEFEGSATLALGRLDATLGDYESARAKIKGLFNTAKDGWARLELGRIEMSLGDIEQARFYFQSLFSTNFEKYARLALCKLEEADNNYEEAEFQIDMINDIDSSVLLEKSMLKASQGKIEEARLILRKLIHSENSIYAYRVWILMEIRMHNYKEALKLTKDAISKNYDINDDILIYLSKKLNMFFDINYLNVKYSYKLDQMINYDGIEAIEHIIKNHINCPEKSNFNSNVDIYKLYHEVKDKLDDKYKCKKTTLMNLYYLPYNNIGINGQNLLKVVTCSDTDNIITMYPVFFEYDYNEEIISVLRKEK